MRSPKTWLSSLRVFGATAVLTTRTPVAPAAPQADREAEIRNLQQKLEVVDRLEWLKTESRRGDLASNTEATTTPAATAPASVKSVAVVATASPISVSDVLGDSLKSSLRSTKYFADASTFQLCGNLCSVAKPPIATRAAFRRKGRNSSSFTEHSYSGLGIDGATT